MTIKTDAAPSCHRTIGPDQYIIVQVSAYSFREKRMKPKPGICRGSDCSMWYPVIGYQDTDGKWVACPDGAYGTCKETMEISTLVDDGVGVTYLEAIRVWRDPQTTGERS